MAIKKISIPKINVQNPAPVKEVVNQDLNNDGKVDDKDKTIAAKVLASNKPEVVSGPQGYKLKKDLTKALRAGDTLSTEKYNELKSRGIDIDVYL